MDSTRFCTPSMVRSPERGGVTAISLTAGFSPPLNNLAIGLNFMGHTPSLSTVTAKRTHELLSAIRHGESKGHMAAEDAHDAPTRPGLRLRAGEPDVSDYNRSGTAIAV